MMASLPSVVLGFIAALVLAPFVQSTLPAVLAAFVAVPAAFVAGAYLWQLLPGRWQVRYGGWQRFLVTAACLPLGVLAAARAGPWLERLLFAGDVELWLDGQRGSARGGWVLLMLPLAVLAVALAVRPFDVWLRRAAARWDAARYAQADFLKFLGAAAAALGIAWALASALTALGLDPRGSVFGTYVQRNALIVGFVMGFAIIPIIYTLAEDALSSVPEHLRLASLAAGATPWQTAMRVIVPTAMSGLFSAVMIGLGRAVGETMIVLMATGNTPVMSWNVFDGFRTLSANIAVELPEAVENSTHYRTLFLAALILFAMTFVLNTFAELVRQRFRRRAYQL
jgi:phosphate transport system permease protein